MEQTCESSLVPATAVKNFLQLFGPNCEGPHLCFERAFGPGIGAQFARVGFAVRAVGPASSQTVLSMNGKDNGSLQIFSIGGGSFGNRVQESQYWCAFSSRASLRTFGPCCIVETLQQARMENPPTRAVAVRMISREDNL